VELGLEQYFPYCLRAGFHNWESLSHITEAQLAAINFRLGHRRKLQREIARRRLQWPDHRPLPTALELQEQTQVLHGPALGVNPELLSESPPVVVPFNLSLGMPCAIKCLARSSRGVSI
jgi:hypothetical protein